MIKNTDKDYLVGIFLQKDFKILIMYGKI